jgi:hypothetical protein
VTTDWITRGLCVGAPADAWFGDGELSPDKNTALLKQGYNTCEQCPVSRPCYELAATTGEAHGIWGGVPFGGKSNRVYVRRRLTRMQEIWAARGEATHPVGKFTDADRWFDPTQRDALILPLTKARTTLPRAQRGRQPRHGNESCWRRGCRCEDCTAWKQQQDDRRRQAAAEAAS